MKSNSKNIIILGAVAYAPKVVDIWEGFKTFFAKQGFSFDFILFSNYELQVESLLRREIDVAWNSPLAWLRAQRMAKFLGQKVVALAMRDSDCDLTSVIISLNSSCIESVSDLAGRKIAVGAVDSPQATLIPLQILKEHGIEESDTCSVVFNNIFVGKHGDHVGGEEEAFKLLINGSVDAACMIKSNFNAFIGKYKIPENTIRILHETRSYDHCNFTALLNHKSDELEEFTKLLMNMSYDDPEIRPLLDMEGLKKWRHGRVSEYDVLDRAIDSFRFYDLSGNILRSDYVY
ncbi:MAG TPA: PhnD/SsuA/transferrin family substrate-binding protein [Oligoflexia bacterium]|nr:PhnD/SsuA/transferrin family substrate-binding protein [Oligoflexia bacterium]HMP47416.1 PhnD/SsuA/transferrin family substrate-binding protein [Oligoflexia bacterium]